MSDKVSRKRKEIALDHAVKITKEAARGGHSNLSGVLHSVYKEYLKLYDDVLSTPE